MKKIYKNTILLIILVLGLLILTGCDIDIKKYNVSIIETNYSFKDGVLENYIPYGSFNKEINDYMTDANIPEDYTITIRNNEKLDELFVSFPNVDFTKEMVIVYIYTGIYDSERKIKDVDLDEGELSIEFSHKLRSGTGSASMPQQRVLIIKMNAVNAYDIDVDVD